MRKYNYKGFEITTKQISSRFGNIWNASNNIGEPYLDNVAFLSEKEAVNKEMENIDKYLEQ